MNGQSRAGQITYYEQLGVPANASAEEIRDAYRALARLLHPDQQTDLNLKRIAEQQMRKLNPIYTVLSDPARRRQYDEDLADDYVAPIILERAPAAGITKLVGRSVWVVAIVIAAGLLYWLATGGSGNPFSSDEAHRVVPVIAPSPQPADGGHSDSEVASLQSQIKTLTAERDFAMTQLQRIKGPNVASVPSAPPPSQLRASAAAPTLTELPAAQPRPDAAPKTAQPKPTAKPTLAGFWFYTAPKGQKNKTQPYPPDYIETTIVEENGVVKGKYRSRIQFTDRAANPEVNFTFTGTPSGGTLTCPWVGQGGAKGEVTMKMMSDNSLRLDWAASELGSQMGLASGTAMLTRKVE